jgi:methylmalonyl-CoA epimerase
MTMGGCRVEHIGILVENLDRSLRVFERLLGLGAAEVKDMPDVGMRVASLQAENVRIELIQYTSETGGFGRHVMGSADGYNHIAVEVEDLEPALKTWEAGGARVMEGFPRGGSHGRIAFFDPATTEGLLLEVCEA